MSSISSQCDAMTDMTRGEKTYSMIEQPVVPQIPDMYVLTLDSFFVVFLLRLIRETKC